MEIRFGERTFYFMIMASVLSLIVGGVYAIGSGDPTLHGHDFGEMEFPDCSDGEILTMKGGVWSCGINGILSGGGYEFGGDGCILLWGDAFCDEFDRIDCPLGYDKQKSGETFVFITVTDWSWDHYVCAKSP